MSHVGAEESIKAELRSTARRFLEARLPLDAVGRLSDGPSAILDKGLWSAIAELGWPALPLPEAVGGLEATTDVLGVLHEEFGRSLAPLPYFSTVALAAPVVVDSPEVAEAIADGSATATVACYEDGVASLIEQSSIRTTADSQLMVTGRKVRVPDATSVSVVLVTAVRGGELGIYSVKSDAPGVTISAEPSIDGTRRGYTIEFEGVASTCIATGSRALELLARARRSALICTAFEAIGIAERVLEMIVAHACTRQQFGKAIGAFQAVSGPLADSYVDIQLARALTHWAVQADGVDDPDVDVAVSSAKAAAAQAALRAAERAIQVAGAIGFAWEYDIHRFLRRAMWIDAFEGNTLAHRQLIAKRLLGSEEPVRTVELMDDAEAESFRSQTRAWIRDRFPSSARGLDLVQSMDEFDDVRETWRREMCEAGNLIAHWPTEYGGKAASDVITAIFREESIKMHPRVSHGDCGYDLVAPLLMQYGTKEQKDAYLGPIREESQIWTQGFSEPNAGSDLASLKTRADQTADGWVINGNKIWATYAPVADMIFVLARTDPEATRHRGISCFLVDITTPGIEVRPIKDIAGGVEFAEIFFTDVHVPAENMLGNVNEGWNVAIATLAHERVIESYEDIGELGFLMDRLLDALRERIAQGVEVDAAARDRLAELWCQYQGVRLVQYRCVLALQGAEAPPSENEIVKLVWSEVGQRAARLCLELFASPADASSKAGGAAAFWEWAYLNSRSLTIYAGTSEIIRSVVAERVLGLPRSR